MSIRLASDNFTRYSSAAGAGIQNAPGFGESTLDEVITPNLVAYYYLSDTSDEIGSNTLTNNGTVTFAGTGINGNDATFNGSGQSLVAAAAADFDLNATDFATSFWFNQAADMGSGTYCYFSIGQDNNNILNMHVDNKRLTLYIRSGASTVVTIRSDASVGDWNPSGSTWHHVMVSRDGNEYYLHVDGVLDSNVTDADGMPTGNRSCYIGYYPSVAYDYTGQIDEFFVAKGMTFTGSTQVDSVASALYNSGTGRFYTA